jgi:hypothetical protein
MENTPYLYDTLLGVLGQHAKWLDTRHRHTLAWMMLGLISSKTIRLGAWVPFVLSRARYAQSTVRRFSRWLHNNRIKPPPLYGPLIEQALRAWVGKRLYVALDRACREILLRATVPAQGPLSSFFHAFSSASV